ncbi:MAG: hypothetical protein J6S05_08840 [Bacteroidaceae bacterium]|nr:hypothetical protein [Bacteroidaceae bacterium]
MAQNNRVSLISSGFANSRLKLYIGKNGELIPDSFMCCERECFNPLGLAMNSNTPTGRSWLRLQDKIDRATDDFIDEAMEKTGHSRTEYEGIGVDMTTPARKIVASQIISEADALRSKANKERSMRRARIKCRDYVLGNSDLDMMVTLTINPDMCDRHDYYEIVKKLSAWLSNRVRRSGLKYVLVPERHKDGAIHFHGFINSGAVKLSKTKYKRDYNGNNFIYALEPTRKGRQIYNIADWDIGYTTAVRIGRSEADREATASYILKYLAKQNEKVGGRWYLHGGDLLLPIEVYMCYNYLDVPCEAVTPTAGINIKVITKKTNSTFLGKLNFGDINDLGISTKNRLRADTKADEL